MEITNENIQDDEKIRRLCLLAVYAEAFFIALSPWAAAAALIIGVLLWLYRFIRNKDREFIRTKVDKFILAFFAPAFYNTNMKWGKVEESVILSHK